MRILALPLLILAVGCSKPAREAIVITNNTGQVLTNVSVRYVGKVVEPTDVTVDFNGRLLGLVNDTFETGMMFGFKVGSTGRGREILTNGFEAFKRRDLATFAKAMSGSSDFYVRSAKLEPVEPELYGRKGSVGPVVWIGADTAGPTNCVATPTDDAIRALAKSGDICRVLGHNWVGGRPGETAAFAYADYHPGTTFRHCSICSTTQSKSEGDWK